MPQSEPVFIFNKINSKNEQKVLKAKKRDYTSVKKKRSVPKAEDMKPAPIPELKGKVARDFERSISLPSTAIQRETLKNATLVYKKIRRE
jgi:hypothetical protein